MLHGYNSLQYIYTCILNYLANKDWGINFFLEFILLTGEVKITTQ